MSARQLPSSPCSVLIIAKDSASPKLSVAISEIRLGASPQHSTAPLRISSSPKRNVHKTASPDRANQLRYLVPMHRRDFLQLATMACACRATPTDIPKYR